MKTKILFSIVSAKALLVAACSSSSNDSSPARTVAGSFAMVIKQFETATTATEVAEAVVEERCLPLFSADDLQVFPRVSSVC